MQPPYDTVEAIAHLGRRDAVMGALIERVGPYRLTLRYVQSPFLGLLRAIVYQQLSGKAAATIHGRLQDLFDEGPPSPEALLALPDTALRGAGLSAAKTAAARDLAIKTLDGVVPSAEALTTMQDEEIVERLVSVRGIGRWTVEMLLMFNLGRPNLLPLDDLGIRKGFMLTYGLEALPRPAELRHHGERWAPYRTVASWYLWRAVDQVL